MDSTETDLKFLQRTLELAARGVGLVSPNPLVGCVILSRSGEVVGEGSYVYDDVKHAEAIALEQAGAKASGGTAYVSLEPHDHENRTPPCTEALINAGIKRVVCPIEDPNPLVSGQGFNRLREAGIEVCTGLLADEATRLNEKFICWHEKKRPFVHLKLAMSLDGRISLNRNVSTTITGPVARERVQQFRHEHDAILIGGNTAFVDNPSLTDRSGRPRRRPLVRIVLDNRLRLPLGSRLVTSAQETPTVVFSNSQDQSQIDALQAAGVVVIRVDARDLSSVLECLRIRCIQSILVEGGTEVAGAFCDAKYVDKITFIAAPIVIGGTEAPVAVGGKGSSALDKALKLKDLDIRHLGEDVEITGYPE